MSGACIVLAVSGLGFCVVGLLAARRERKAAAILRNPRVVEDAAHDQFLADVGLSRKDVR